MLNLLTMGRFVCFVIPVREAFRQRLMSLLLIVGSHSARLPLYRHRCIVAFLLTPFTDVQRGEAREQFRVENGGLVVENMPRDR